MGTPLPQQGQNQGKDITADAPVMVDRLSTQDIDQETHGFSGVETPAR